MLELKAKVEVWTKTKHKKSNNKDNNNNNNKKKKNKKNKKKKKKKKKKKELASSSARSMAIVLAFDKLYTSTSKSTNTLSFKRLFTSVWLKCERRTRNTSSVRAVKLWIKVRDSEELRLVYPGKKVLFTLICTLKVFTSVIPRNTNPPPPKKKLSN